MISILSQKVCLVILHNLKGELKSKNEFVFHSDIIFVVRPEQPSHFLRIMSNFLVETTKMFQN